MWRPEAQLPMADLLLRTVQDQSEWSGMDANEQPLVIAGIDSPALRWLLRDRPVEIRSSAGAGLNPPMVISRDEQDPALTSAYRGQSFVWRSTPAWRLFRLPEWLPFHETSQETENIILWVRNDLFPDAQPSNGGLISPAHNGVGESESVDAEQDLLRSLPLTARRPPESRHWAASLLRNWATCSLTPG